MAAVIQLHTGTAVPASPPDDAERPRLSLLEGGRSEAALRRQRMYLRRRVVAALAAFVVVIAFAAAAGGAVRALTSTGPVATSVHEVQRGDTLWAIANAIDPTGDPRDVIDRIVALNAANGSSGFSAGAPLVPGQQLVVPALSD
jgi:nucleoid-associated protein YgaU